MNILELIAIVVGVPAIIYFLTRLFYGEYEFHYDKDDWLFAGWDEYKPGNLRPIHFFKTTLWIVGVVVFLFVWFEFLFWAFNTQVF